MASLNVNIRSDSEINRVKSSLVTKHQKARIHDVQFIVEKYWSKKKYLNNIQNYATHTKLPEIEHFEKHHESIFTDINKYLKDDYYVSKVCGDQNKVQLHMRNKNCRSKLEKFINKSLISKQDAKIRNQK